MSSESSRAVLITGGTSGIGQALVKAYTARTYSVTFQYHKNEAAAKLLAEQFGATAVQADFAELPKPIDGQFDIVVNNAAIPAGNELVHHTDMFFWQKTMNVNVTAAFVMAGAAIPHMLEQQWGRIINIASVYALTSAPGRSSYVASKHALLGLTRSIAREYAAQNITCNAICPGAVDTEQLGKKIAATSGRRGVTRGDVLKEYISQIPAGRLAQPTDIAEMAVYLCTEQAAYVNGTSMVVDGGRLA